MIIFGRIREYRRAYLNGEVLLRFTKLLREGREERLRSDDQEEKDVDRAREVEQRDTKKVAAEDTDL